MKITILILFFALLTSCGGGEETDKKISIFFDNITYSNENENIIIFDDAVQKGSLSGNMGIKNGISIEHEISCLNGGEESDACLKITYNTEAETWAGIYLLAMSGDWDTTTDILEEMTALSFQVKSSGNVVVKEIGMGTENDSAGKHAIFNKNIGTEWQEHTIDLSNVNLSAVTGLFYIAIEAAPNKQ